MTDLLDKLRSFGLTDLEISIMARLYDGKSRQQVGDELGYSAGTISQYYSRARKKLAAAGHPIPKMPGGPKVKEQGHVVVQIGFRGKPRYLDPAVMDSTFSYSQRYNAVEKD